MKNSMSIRDVVIGQKQHIVDNGVKNGTSLTMKSKIMMVYIRTLRDWCLESMTNDVKNHAGCSTAVRVYGKTSRASHVHGFCSDGIPSASMASAR